MPTGRGRSRNPRHAAGPLSARSHRRQAGGMRRRCPPRRRTGAPPRARCRGGVPPLPFQRPAQGRYWLVGDVRNTPGRSLFVRLHRTRVRQGCCRQMDRCRHRRAWRSARPDRAQSRPRPVCATLLDEARAFLRLPRPEPDIDRLTARRQRRPVHRNPRGACSRWRGRSPAPWPRPICASAA